MNESIFVVPKLFGQVINASHVALERVRERESGLAKVHSRGGVSRGRGRVQFIEEERGFMALPNEMLYM